MDKTEESFLLYAVWLIYLFFDIYYQKILYTAESNLFDILEKGLRYYSDFGLVGVVGNLNRWTGLLSDELMNCVRALINT